MILKSVKRSLRKLIEVKNSLPAYLHWKKKFKDDPLFKLSSVNRGLLPRPTSASRTDNQRTAVAKRIIEAYRCAIDNQQSQREIYKPSYQWLPIFKNNLMPLIDKLNQGDAVGLRDILDNFFRSNISTGLCGLPTDMVRTFFTKPPSRYARELLLIDMIYRYRLLESLLPGIKLSDLHIDDFGNPYGIYVGEHFLRGGFDYTYYYANRVAQLLGSSGEHSTVAELGGGVGGFAYYLNKIYSSNLTYIDFDLPEILCIASYQLLNLFPEKRFLLYGEVEHIDSAVIATYDIALLPCFLIESLANDSVDVSFNSYSLAEMSLETIQNYASHLSRVSRKAIFHVNHVSNVLVGGDRFPFDMNKFELKDRSRALWNLGINLKCDEYEFLLTRKSS